MHALETEKDPAREGQTKAPVDAPRRDPKPIPEGARTVKHFSPDPMQGTDRYRLVTPYGLSPDERSGE